MSSRRQLIIIAVTSLTVGLIISLTVGLIITNGTSKCPACKKESASVDSHRYTDPMGHAYYNCDPEEVRKHEVCHVSRSNWDYDR